MIELNKISRIYFIGIGGIGMSALARYFNENGIAVCGYDKTSTALTKQMQDEGINIHYEDSINLLDKDAELVVYTPAIPGEHIELNYYKQQNYAIVKRSDVLQLITNNSFNICIAGTHGKTTITTLVAHILRDSGYSCTAFLGGISVNYNTNFWKGNNNICVIEADEYDRSFLKLKPAIAVISAMDADHLDIYGTEEAMQQAFSEFSKNIKSGGLLVSKFGLNKAVKLSSPVRINYSLQNDSADAYAANIKMVHGGYQFDVLMKDWMIDNIELHMGGMHNVENAIAAIVIANHLKIDSDKIRTAIKNFKGIKRRFEYIIFPSLLAKRAGNNIIYIDDYAHHPEELKALISGAKSLFGSMKCTIIFQPHLYTRTRDLAAEFAKALDLADQIILLPIYPARELPIEGVTSELIVKNMKNPHVQVLDKKEILNWLKNIKASEDLSGVYITAGAGDIDTLAEPVKNILTSKMKAGNYA